MFTKLLCCNLDGIPLAPRVGCAYDDRASSLVNILPGTRNVFEILFRLNDSTTRNRQ